MLSLRYSGVPNTAMGGSISSTMDEKRTAGARSEDFAAASVRSAMLLEQPMTFLKSNN